MSFPSGEKAAEYTDIFLDIESKTEMIASYSKFVLSNPQMTVDSSDFSTVWLSPPNPGYNETNQPANWSYLEQDLYPYNETIRKGLVIFELINSTVEQDDSLSQGFFAFPGRITLLDPESVQGLRSQRSDLYPPSRPWYTPAVNGSGPIWAGPYIEATTATMTMTSAMLQEIR